MQEPRNPFMPYLSLGGETRAVTSEALESDARILEFPSAADPRNPGSLPAEFRGSGEGLG
jgi:hypothetical protein